MRNAHVFIVSVAGLNPLLTMNFAGRISAKIRPFIRSFHVSNQILGYSCWSCGTTGEKLTANLFCGHCNALQQPDKLNNYFELMGVRNSYEVDENDLAKKYKELQKYLHPDKFSNKDKNEQAISAEYSSLINEAYNTLLHPLARGIYMLRLHGMDLPEQTQMDKDFLMDIMEKNEEVENASSEADIMRLNEENRKVLEELTKQVSKAFFEDDMNTVVKILSHMKYYSSIDNQIQAVIRSKGIIR